MDLGKYLALTDRCKLNNSISCCSVFYFSESLVCYAHWFHWGLEGRAWEISPSLSCYKNMVQKLTTEYFHIVAVVELFETTTMVKSCTDGLAWLSVFVLISDIILPPEKRIINVRQQPCSVRSERDAGTYVEFCRLPERLGSSSNNINENNDNSNNNIITTL